MKAYILAIAGAVLITAVISVISPNGKIGKFIKGAMKLLVLVVLISPFTNWFGGGKFQFSEKEIGTDQAYLEHCAALLSEEDEKRIAKNLEEEYSVTADIKVTRNPTENFSFQKITVKILDYGIIGQDEHINILIRIREALQKKYGCITEVT